MPYFKSKDFSCLADTLFRDKREFIKINEVLASVKIRVRRSTSTGNCQFGVPWCRSLAATLTMLSVFLVVAFIAVFMVNPPDSYLEGVSVEDPAFWIGTSGPSNFDWTTLTSPDGE